METKKKADTSEYSKAETTARRDETVKRMLATPPKKHEPLKATKKRKSKTATKRRSQG